MSRLRSGPGSTSRENRPAAPGPAAAPAEGLDLVNWKQVGSSGGTAITIEAGSSFTGNSPASNVTIQGNYIGVGPDGTTVEGNDVYGIQVAGQDNTIGGTTATTRNLIAGSGNVNTDGAGVAVINEIFSTAASGNVIEGNYIGVGADGETASPNNIGVLMGGASDNTIGGTTSGAGNVISGNTMAGISMDDDTADTVQGNIIGTNGGGGILVSDGASKDTIGGIGAGAGNVISSNTGNGVTVGSSATDSATVGIAIEGNSVTANSALGIDLGDDGVTPNDSGPAGPDDFQNYPVLSSATISGSNATITGTFDEDAEPDTTLRIEFFGDPTGFGQGATFLGSTSVTTDANADAATIEAAVSAPPAGDLITATATVTSTTATGINVGDTSEFSADITPTPSSTSTGDATSITSLTINPAPGTANQPSNVIVVVADTTNSDTTPTGEVDILANGSIVASGDLDGGTATIPVTLSADTYSITANYVGDNGFQRIDHADHHVRRQSPGASGRDLPSR